MQYETNMADDIMLEYMQWKQRGMVDHGRRSANQDMYLAMYAEDHDVLTPEFIRAYEHVTFNGWDCLQAEKASTMKVPDPDL